MSSIVLIGKAPRQRSSILEGIPEYEASDCCPVITQLRISSMSQKRQFPFYSAVESFGIGSQNKRLGDDPSREYVEPAVFQARQQGEFDEYEALTVSSLEWCCHAKCLQ